MMKRANTSVAGLLGLGLVVAWCGSAASQQVPPLQETPSSAAVRQAEAMSLAFRQAAEAVLPTVVTIHSKIEARRVSGRGNQLGDNPFRGTPLEQFFDEELRQQLEQQIPEQEGTGSGVIIDSAGVILTNNHVVSEADLVTVQLSDGRQFTATEIHTDPQTDLAIVRIKSDESLPAARLGDSDRLQIGDWVLAIGNPFNLDASVSAGIISAKGRSLGAARRTSFLQTDAAINPGNSGGPLVNLRGEIVGINTAIASSSGGYQGIGFAIPVNLAKWVSRQLVEHGKVSRAWLGIGIRSVTPDMAQALGIDLTTQGVLAYHVGNDTPAERAGIQPGDVITHFAGRPVASPSQLQHAVERVPLDSRQEVRILRNGQPQNLTVTTEALPDELAGNSNGRRGELGQVTVNPNVGLQLQDVTAELARQLGLEEPRQGVLITRVLPGSIAHESGLIRGMLILQADGQQIESVQQFNELIKEKSLDQGVRLLLEIPGQGRQFAILKRR